MINKELCNCVENMIQKKIGHMEYLMKIYQQMLINGMMKINGKGVVPMI